MTTFAVPRRWIDEQPEAAVSDRAIDLLGSIPLASGVAVYSPRIVGGGGYLMPGRVGGTLGYGTAPQVDRVEVVGDVSPWARATVRDLVRLTALPPNWDSYGGGAIEMTALESAANFANFVMGPSMPRPAVVPTSRGGVQLEWHTRGVDLEIEFVGASMARFEHEDHRAGSTSSGDVADDWLVLMGHFRELGRR